MVKSSWSLLALSAVALGTGLALGRFLRAGGTDANAAAGGAGDALIKELEQEIERQKRLRAQERAGRTNAEREAREALQRRQEAEGYAFEGVAYVDSCFADRRGTPRQGSLVPAAKASIRFRSTVPPAALEGLEQYSHLWVIFVFHENTNAAGAAKKSTFPAKIAPPRLGGKKVGLFSTRTPHRPNSIGLTVVKIDAIHGRTIDISGHDLVHGTPVLDVKPYVFADYVDGYQCPSWVNDVLDAERRVEFSDQAAEELERIVKQRRSKFYSTVADLRRAIEQMLVLDIRSVHQGRGAGASGEAQRFECRFDVVAIEFRTLEHAIVVERCAPIESEASTRENGGVAGDATAAANSSIEES